MDSELSKAGYFMLGLLMIGGILAVVIGGPVLGVRHLIAEHEREQDEAAVWEMNRDRHRAIDDCESRNRWLNDMVKGPNKHPSVEDCDALPQPTRDMFGDLRKF